MVTDENLLEALKRTRKARICPRFGICSNVSEYLFEMEAHEEGYYGRLLELFEDWPLFTGDYSYPVPHPRRCPVYAYENSKLWSRLFQYGRNRFALLDHAIAKLEAEIAEKKGAGS